MSVSEIRLSICKSAPRSRQITTPAPHHSVFFRLDALPAAQPTASKHWREQALKATFLSWSHSKMSLKLQILVVKHRSVATSSVFLVWSLQQLLLLLLLLPVNTKRNQFCCQAPPKIWFDVFVTKDWRSVTSGHSCGRVLQQREFFRHWSADNKAVWSCRTRAASGTHQLHQRCCLLVHSWKAVPYKGL